MIGEASTIDRPGKRVTVIAWRGDTRNRYSLRFRGRTYFEFLTCIDDIDAKVTAIDHLRADKIIVQVTDIDVIVDRRRH